MDAKERFYRHFRDEIATLKDEIGKLGSIGKGRQDATESILAAISKLSNEVADASDYVPAYDQRSYSQAIKSLTDQLNEETAKLAPKSRFQFKPRKAAATSSGPASSQDDPRLMRGTPTVPGPDSSTAIRSGTASSDAQPPPTQRDYNKELATACGPGIRRPSFSAARDIRIADHDGLHIVLPPSASRAVTNPSSGSLTNLGRCVVDMSPMTTAPGAAPLLGLALKNISRSLVVAGRVDGPAHVTGVRDGVVVAAARQVRVHECTNVVLYLHCASRPIIEDCAGMRFAPLPACYMDQMGELGSNQWDQVDDFKWLKADHSPNWGVLPERDRLSEDVWRNTLLGPQELHLDDILARVGVSESVDL